MSLQIQPFFFSHLPLNCIYLIYDKLIYNRRLPESLKEDIHLFHKLDSIMFTSINSWNTFNIVDPSYGLNVLENDLMWILNNNYALIDGISPALQDEYPWITVNYLQSLFNMKEKSTIFKLWSLLNTQKKKHIINYLCK